MEVGWKRFLSDLRGRRYRFRQAVGGFFGAFLFVLADWDVRPWVFALGAALCAVGAFIRLWAAGLVRKNEVLETRGPYAYVRHPQYLGNCLLAAGVCVATGHVWALAVWALVFWLFYVPAIRREDEKLSRRFGEAWREWASRTPAILPLPGRGGGRPRQLGRWSVWQSVRNGEYVWLALITLGMASVYVRMVLTAGAVGLP